MTAKRRRIRRLEPGTGPWYWDDYGSTSKEFVDGLRHLLGLAPLAEEHGFQRLVKNEALRANPSEVPKSSPQLPPALTP